MEDDENKLVEGWKGEGWRDGEDGMRRGWVEEWRDGRRRLSRGMEGWKDEEERDGGMEG